MKPKLFISYTNGGQLGKQVSEELYSVLNASGFIALRDRERLRHGDKWHDGLDDMMSECHGAVIVLSPEVEQSDWVRREATILSHRKRVCEDFALLPLLVGAACAPQWPGLGLEDLNPFQQAAPDDLAELVAPGSVLDIFRTQFACNYPESLVQAKLTATLRQVQPERLVALAEELGAEIHEWAGDKNLAGLLARHLAAEVLSKPVDQVAGKLDHVFTDLGWDKCLEILKLLASNWVPVDAVRQLRQADCNGGKCFALNSQDDWTRKMYLRRARGSFKPWESLTALGVHGGEDEADMIASDLRGEWDSVMSSRGRWSNRKQVLKDYGEPVFAVITPPDSDHELQSLIADKAGGLTFLLADNALLEERCRADYPSAEFLCPGLREGEELAARNKNSVAKAQLEAINARLNEDEL